MAGSVLLRLIAAGALAFAACKTHPVDPEIPAIEHLHAYEVDRLAHTDFANVPPSSRSLGADPYALRALPGGGRFAGILRGRDALVLLDDSLREIARAPAGPSPNGLDVAADGKILVGNDAGEIGVFEARGDSLVAVGKHVIEGAVAIRDVVAAAGAFAAYAVEDERGRLIAVPREGEKPVLLPACVGAVHLALTARRDALVVDCVLDHTLLIRPLDARGVPDPSRDITIRHDGPIWSFDTLASDDPSEVLIAAGGIEDHPLDRTEGSFGFIDSFVFFYRVTPRGAERLAEIDVSDLGVVTPKSIAFDRSAAQPTLIVSGAGSGTLVKLVLSADRRRVEPSGPVQRIAPGAESLVVRGAEVFFANPLLDAWGAIGPSGERRSTPEPIEGAERRVGEALIFTTLMAPWNKSEGRLSRFTCEACHFEGYGDGRIHFTGRGQVHATTRPLLGLWGDRPYFSRALDADMVTVAYNEFKVAGAKSDHDPWFSIKTRDYPWLPALGVTAQELSAEDLRRAFIAFLADFSPRPNPRARALHELGPLAREGMAVFQARCERCHAARLVSEDPSSRVDPSRWESILLGASSPIVWASSDSYKTGVEPYVNDQTGARVPSLRRLYKKSPYFTNGSVKTLRDVLRTVRFGGAGELFHAGAGDRTNPESGVALDRPVGLTDHEVDALEEFLDLL